MPVVAVVVAVWVGLGLVVGLCFGRAVALGGSAQEPPDGDRGAPEAAGTPPTGEREPAA